MFSNFSGGRIVGRYAVKPNGMDQMIELDLDDGDVVNYEKFKELVGKI